MLRREIERGKRDGEKGEGEREGGRRQREREIVLSKEISCLQHMIHVVVQ